MKIYKVFKETEMTRLFDQLNLFFYFCGMKDFWVSDMGLPRRLEKIYDKIIFQAFIMVVYMMLSNFGAALMQKNLSPRQLSDLTLLGLTTPVIVYHYFVCIYYKAEVRDIFYQLAVVLKEYYYEKITVSDIAKRLKIYIGMFAFAWFSATFERGAHGLTKKIFHGERFRPFATIGPDVTESSTLGLILQIAYYISTWCCGLRSLGINGIVLTLILSLSYQFKDLQTYFYKLDLIFEDNNLSQEEKEKKYEDGFKTGIHLHVLCLTCVHRSQRVLSTIFSAQLLLSTSALIMILKPLVISEGLAAKLPHLPILGADLTILALVMWNCGNLTHEAEIISRAMYSSGWQNCYGMSSVRVRKLVVNAMLQAQQPVVLTAFGVIKLSSENWITIVKTSYSVFSVFY